jgi:nucleotide-binding universal stress UspA family protein
VNTTIRHILVPIDLSDASGRIVDFARTVSGGASADVHLVHVLEEPFTATGPYEWHVADTPARRERLYERARLSLLKTAGQLREAGVRTTVEVRSGAAVEEVVKAAVDYGAELIVMGTHGRGGLHQFLTGGVAAEVIRRAPCPVLVVRNHGGAIAASAA